MGVKGLLPKLINIQQAINVKDLEGTKVGIEASSWLYQVLYPCSWELFTKQKTDRYINLFENSVKLLLRNNVQPVVVFDGDQILAKAGTKEKRNRKKQEAREKANAAMQRNDLEAAKRAANQTIEITDDIVSQIMLMLRKHNVPFLKAPYEADAQLAYMAQAGVIEYVITEDSDLLVYGTPKVIYKWDRNAGVGCLIEGKDMWQSFAFNYSREAFIGLAVLSGCDYLESLPNIGVNRAEKFITAIGGTGILEELKNMRHIINFNIDVPEEYTRNVKKAMDVYKHQIVYDYGVDELCPCTPYPLQFNDHGDYAGEYPFVISFSGE